ncbi:hypothetical protein [Escherichia coli]|uniref:hypothetical protein n=1 Tax=Escherichia coli TaxID=562 RepID=UPI00157A336A|nr:hypothetical protein [Escherichia coli]
MDAPMAQGNCWLCFTPLSPMAKSRRCADAALGIRTSALLFAANPQYDNRNDRREMTEGWPCVLRLSDPALYLVTGASHVKTSRVSPFNHEAMGASLQGTFALSEASG